MPDPALDGKIILAAPDSTSSGWRQLQTILAAMGAEFDDEKGWAYVEQLMPMCFSSTSSKNAPNLTAAEAMMDLLASAEFQSVRA